MLELGCGLALPSVVAARAGARVLATDSAREAVAFAAHTLALDEQVGDVAEVDWREPQLLLEQGPWDLVLAADVLYLHRNVEMLRDLLPKLVAAGGRGAARRPGRAGAGELLGAGRPSASRSASQPGPAPPGGDAAPAHAAGDVMRQQRRRGRGRGVGCARGVDVARVVACAVVAAVQAR